MMSTWNWVQMAKQSLQIVISHPYEPSSSHQVNKARSSLFTHCHSHSRHATLHTVRETRLLLNDFQWSSSHSPDVAPFYFHLFCQTKQDVGGVTT